ncbi:MAG: hypothetical protein AB1609_01890 [Bacillota bacterium]
MSAPNVRRLLRFAAALVVAAVLGLAAWGVTLAVRGASARLVPAVPAPRLPLHAVVVRELGTGQYLLYTEIELKPGDLFISGSELVYRIERVDFDTAWARLLGPRSEVLGPGGEILEPGRGQAGSP